jgi:type IV secretory pathway protease TraF
MSEHHGTLVRIEAPHFVAGIVAEDGRVARTAPILRYMLGWDGQRVAAYVRSKGWVWS